MISEAQFQNELQILIANAIREDVGDGDHSSLVCIPASAEGKAKLLVKDDGLSQVLNLPNDIPVRRSKFNNRDFIVDGTPVKYGDIVFHVSGSSQSILKAERMVLNSMQRMSAIATKTNKYVKLLEGTNTKILDTRKTTPGFRRVAEKWARNWVAARTTVLLYDMIMLKDNHIDFAGGIALLYPKLRRI
jgi:nicotinate-nucleotide pyrophosphorylase (carboxylating)